MTYAGDVTPDEAWQALATDPEAVLVDVRTHAEWSYVGVPDLREAGKVLVTIEWQSYPSGAANEAFVDQLREAGVAQDAPVYFLCRSGVRSIAAAKAATAAGYAGAHNVLEGFEGDLDDAGHRARSGWKVAGLPWRQG
ncbi:MULTISPECIES: rhodanese-like domain-containing protein [unclassified Janibacter]|uniref:rhodanese-like domain-containing protein n=1 Tax=unclassified Janibacter TaxID=2649294 RepID=UPI003D0387E8